MGAIRSAALALALCYIAFAALAQPEAKKKPTVHYLPNKQFRTYLYSQLEGYGKLNTTIKYLKKTNVGFIVSNSKVTETGYTLLVPTDSAWKDVAKKHTHGHELVKMLKGPHKKRVLENLMRYHAIPHYYSAADLYFIVNGQAFNTLLLVPLYFEHIHSEYSNYWYGNKKHRYINKAHSLGPVVDMTDQTEAFVVDSVLVPSNLTKLLVPRYFTGGPLAPPPPK